MSVITANDTQRHSTNESGFDTHFSESDRRGLWQSPLQLGQRQTIVSLTRGLSSPASPASPAHGHLCPKRYGGIHFGRGWEREQDVCALHTRARERTTVLKRLNTAGSNDTLARQSRIFAILEWRFF